MTVRISVPTRALVDRLADLDAEVLLWDGDGGQPDGHVDLLVMPYRVDGSLVAGLDASRVGLVQLQTLGYDAVVGSLPDGVVVANAVGVHEGPTAEIAMALMLASSRRLDEFARADGQWLNSWSPGLIGRTVLVVGAGGIGRELVARLDGFGATVARVGQTARDDAHGHVHATSELPDLLPSAHVVVLAVPLTESTTGLVDAAFLAAMPDDALLVNVSRGKVVVTDAVVAEGGRIRFASDVFDPEPLPADHPLWSTPHVLVSPHVGGMSSSMPDRVETLVRHQAARLAAGEEPDHVVLRG